jgi:quercetin dioxygenase-like cupin family protein
MPQTRCSEWRIAGDRHRVSANASETKPAKLLAVFVVDTNETELMIPFGN